MTSSPCIGLGRRPLVASRRVRLSDPSGRGAVVIVVVFASFFAGWAVRSRAVVPARVLVAADRWVISVALPALVVSKMTHIEIGADLVVPIAAAWGAMGVCAIAVLVASRAAQWSRATTGALLCVAVLGNTSFLGLGMTEGLLGRGHLFAAVAYDQPGTFLALATWGALVASHWGTGSRGWHAVIHRIITFPPFLALVVSIPLRSLNVAETVWDILDALGRTVAPVAMAAVGLRFVPKWQRALVRPVATGLLVKMVCAPVVVALAAAIAGGWGEVAWQSSILQASAPPMVSAGLVAIAAGLDEDTTTMLVGFGTLGAFAWMPIVSVLV